MAQNLPFSYGPFPECHKWRPLANYVIVTVNRAGDKQARLVACVYSLAESA